MNRTDLARTFLRFLACMEHEFDTSGYVRPWLMDAKAGVPMLLPEAEHALLTETFNTMLSLGLVSESDRASVVGEVRS